LARSTENRPKLDILHTIHAMEKIRRENPFKTKISLRRRARKAHAILLKEFDQLRDGSILAGNRIAQVLYETPFTTNRTRDWKYKSRDKRTKTIGPNETPGTTEAAYSHTRTCIPKNAPFCARKTPPAYTTAIPYRATMAIKVLH